MSQAQLTVLYDGSCPICAWEQRNLARRDKHGHLGFINIHDPEFDPHQFGATMDELMASLHAIAADGRVLKGVDTMLACYRAVGWWWAYLPLNALPRSMADKGYEWFARNRHVISRHFCHLFGSGCAQGTCRHR